MSDEMRVSVTLLSEADIQQIIDKRFADEKRLNVPKPVKKTNLDPNDAIEYLSQIGYKCSLSQLYKGTSLNEIPFSKFGRKLVFTPDSLSKWVESKKSKTVDIAGNVSRSANSKIGRN